MHAVMDDDDATLKEADQGKVKAGDKAELVG
jgi:hypothetical protein